MLSCIYLTRKCPNKCVYCKARDSKVDAELTVEQWKKAFYRLAEMGVDFYLLLGNELLMKDGIVEIMHFLTNELKVAYAFYSTYPEPYYSQLRQPLIDLGITNVSCGVDIQPLMPVSETHPYYDIYAKAKRGISALSWFAEKGVPDIQATITCSKLNSPSLIHLVKYLTARKFWIGINQIHWDKDGHYDFFPSKADIEYMLLSQDDITNAASELYRGALEGEYKIQNPPPYFLAWAECGYDLSWHCRNPLIVTVDADGSYRCCGYRKGDNSPKLNILTDDISTYQLAWEHDQKACPGCFWSYWWMAEYYRLTETPAYAHGVFATHDTKYFNIKE